MAKTKIKIDDRYWIETDPHNLVLCWKNKKEGGKLSKSVHKLYYATLSQLLCSVRELKIKRAVLRSYEDLKACLEASDDQIKGFCAEIDAELIKKLKGEV